MKVLLILNSLIIVSFTMANNPLPDYNVYLFPGQGSDYRVFKEIVFPENFNLHNISYPVPGKNTSMRDFALELSEKIDTTSPFILIGHSLGGMICTELNCIVNPEMTIIISSAKSWNELPFRYRMLRKMPLQKIIPAKIIKAGSLILQPVVEPDRNQEKELFVSMLKKKDPLYLKRTINMIINWQRKSLPDEIIHIHGDADHTIPVRNVCYDHKIPGGSHMMLVTRGKEISCLVNEIFSSLEVSHPEN